MILLGIGIGACIAAVLILIASFILLRWTRQIVAQWEKSFYKEPSPDTEYEISSDLPPKKATSG